MKRRGVRAATGYPLPIEAVVGEVGVGQRVPEPARTMLPVDTADIHQKRGRNHTNAIMHPSCLPQLPPAELRVQRFGSLLESGTLGALRIILQSPDGLPCADLTKM